MAFEKKIGNIPVLHEYYLVGDIGNNILNGGLNIQTYKYIDNIGTDMIRQKALVLKPSQWEQDDVYIDIPVNSTVNASLNTHLQYVINKRGETIADIYADANSVLGISRQNTYIYAYSEQANQLVYVFAIALYGGDGNVLKGYWICGAINQTVGEGMNYMPAGGSVDTVINLQVLQSLDYEIPETNESEEYGPASEEEGYGTGGKPAFDHTSDLIPIPDMPTVSTSSTGFMHVYKVASGALSTLGQYLFPTIGNITDLESALRAIAGIFAYRDSVQYIVDLHAIPISPPASGSEYIKIGQLTTDITQPVVPIDYVDFDCGSVSIPEQYRNFVDYTGTRCKLFLPFVGFVDIAPEYWNGGTLSVKYRFNVIDGSFMAYVRSTSSKSNLANSLIGQFGGAACIHLPVIAASYGALASGLVGGSMQIASSAASGNVGGVISGALTAGNFQPSVSQSNNYNSSTSFLGGRRPYLLIEREVPCFSTKYTHDKGLPANVAFIIGNVHGYTEIEDVDLSGLDYTQEEIEELRGLLAGGVYL